MRLSDAVKALKDAGIENPRAEARLIFSEKCKIPLNEMLISDVESELADEAVLRRCAREPLQYILGRVSFYREEYLVSPDCLIPRSDTEILVEYAVSHLESGARFLDLCTGSGCVAISTLKNTKETRAVAVDISEGALKIAMSNAELNGVLGRVEFLNTDALSGAIDGEFDALLCNPPYIRDEVYRTLEKEIFHEPREALVADEDGLLFYKRLIPLYKDKIKKGGFMAFEIGYDQADALKDIARESGLSLKILKDFSNNDRVAVIDL